MPELPEVETVRRSLRHDVTGRRIERVEVRERRLRRPVPARKLRREAPGRRIEGVSRRAKYLLFDLEGGWRLVVHLGMTGRLYLRPAPEPAGRHEHVLFHLEGGTTLRFEDPRRFGLIDLVRAEDLTRDPRFRDLGVEPLSRACTARYLRERSRGLRRPVKTFLMDGRYVAGLGNIYASEALYRAGVRPERPVAGLGLGSWERVAAAVKDVLREALRRGGTTISDFRDGRGARGWFQLELRVYGREGSPCARCGRRVRRRVLAGRSTFYCPGCQR